MTGTSSEEGVIQEGQRMDQETGEAGTNTFYLKFIPRLISADRTGSRGAGGQGGRGFTLIGAHYTGRKLTQLGPKWLSSV